MVTPETSRGLLGQVGSVCRKRFSGPERDKPPVSRKFKVERHNPLEIYDPFLQYGPLVDPFSGGLDKEIKCLDC